MDLNLKHKHILITGGSKGIGLACAKTFLDEGAKVSLVSRDHATLVTAKKQLAENCSDSDARIAIFSADLKNAQSAANALDQAERDFGPVDVLVNSAGAAKRASVDELTPAIWREAMDAKFFTYINMMDPVIKRMGARRSGVVVNVIGAGGKSPTVLHVSGGSANAALMLATAGLAAAYAPLGVRVNAVNPGPVLTGRLKDGLAVAVRHQNISEEEAMKNLIGKMAIGRVADPAEIADTVVYLASDRASYVTGTIITMDGAASPMVV